MENGFNQNGVNGCRALASLLMCGRPIERLDFDRNGLSGIDDVTAALATNPQIRALSMTENKLNDRDAELIAQALKPNTNLQQLYLGENNITATGFEKIRTAIYDPSSLNAIEACNHTCYINCVELNDDFEGVKPLALHRNSVDAANCTRCCQRNTRWVATRATSTQSWARGHSSSSSCQECLSAYSSARVIDRRIHHCRSHSYFS